MIRVCHILDTLNVGGIERNVIEIVHGLKSYEHHVWCIGKKGVLAAELEKSGIEIREFGYEGPMRLDSLIALSGAMRRAGFDIVNGHGLYPSMWSRLAGFLAGVPVRIAHAQSLYLDLGWWDIMKLRLLMSITTKMVAVSEAVKKNLMHTIGLPERKIEVIYNASPDMKAMATGARSALRESFGFGKSFVVGCIGRLVDFKGHEYLIEGVRRARQNGIDVTCVIVGDGPDRKKLETIVREASLDEAFRFLGVRNDVASLLGAMDALIQPSIVREGLPLTLAEGASAGLPLIATAIGGNIEIVINGENGFIVPPRDAEAIAEKIAILAANPVDTAKMGEASRKIWESRFTTDLMTEKVGKLYAACLGGMAQ